MRDPLLTKRSASNRTTPNAYNNRGAAKAALGRYDDALADYDEAVRLKPDYAYAYYNRGAANDDAIFAFDQAPSRPRRSLQQPGRYKGRVRRL